MPWPQMSYGDVLHCLRSSSGDFTAEKFKSYKNLKAHGYSVSRKIGSTKNFTLNFNPDIYAALKA